MLSSKGIATRPGADDASRWMRDLLELADGGVVALDGAWRFALVNEHAAAVLGAEARELVGRRIWDVQPAGRDHPFRAHCEAARASGRPAVFEARSPTDRWYEIRAVPQGEMLYLWFHEITERKRREAELAGSEARFRSLVEATSQLIFRMDPQGRNIGGSDSWSQYTGRPIDAAHGDGWLAFVHPDDRERVRLRHGELLAAPGVYEGEFRLRRHDGTYRRFALRIVPVRDPDGTLQEFVGACVDVEDRHRTELERNELVRALDAKRERLSSIVEAMPVGVALFEAGSGRVLQSNRAFEHLDGEPVRALLQRPLDRAIHQGEPVEAGEARLAEGDRWLRLNTVPLRDPSGAVVSCLAVAIDVTKRKQAEEALRASESLLRFCLETMPQHVWMGRPDGSIAFFNQRWLEFTGLSLVASVDYGWTAAIHPDDVMACRQAWERAIAGGTIFEVELRLRAADGSHRWFLVRALPMHDADGRILHWFGTNTDIDDQKRTREATEALEEFQHQLIGVVSHDLRSPLAAMTTTVGVLLRGTSLGPSERRAIERIRDTAERMRRITRDLLDYTQARVGAGLPIDPVPAEVSAICRAAAAEARILAPQRRIAVEGEGSADVCWDARRIEQALSNLLGNAIKYGDGEIALRWQADDRNVAIEVDNEGDPIGDRVLPQLFRPFRQGDRREAPMTQSLGLGLYIVREIARAHGGTAAIEALPRGNRVRLVLPRRP